ncbi:hypothetical protein ZIOFF_017875 [Zingiber officinale]|uniref:EGF-like domain-containing protein n=1 Tax=Zingiber officinale TaxID=94328 RepID=A0A8J5LLN9_ZINOF|nr:hypothetical protein ZIOFF_017875 [Zingiber officinale]
MAQGAGVFDHICYNDSMARPPSTITQPSNRSLLFDPCMWSFCGRGRCARTTSFGHRCECKEGFSNLLNDTNLPCLKECVVTADCPILGFALSNGSSSPPNFSYRSSGGVVLKRAVCSTTTRFFCSRRFPVGGHDHDVPARAAENE